jgi:hypothetical protein
MRERQHSTDRNMSFSSFLLIHIFIAPLIPPLPTPHSPSHSSPFPTPHSILDTLPQSSRYKMVNDFYESNFDVVNLVTEGPGEKCVDIR